MVRQAPEPYGSGQALYCCGVRVPRNNNLWFGASSILLRGKGAPQQQVKCPTSELWGTRGSGIPIPEPT